MQGSLLEGGGVQLHKGRKCVTQDMYPKTPYWLAVFHIGRGSYWLAVFHEFQPCTWSWLWSAAYRCQVSHRLQCCSLPVVPFLPTRLQFTALLCISQSLLVFAQQQPRHTAVAAGHQHAQKDTQHEQIRSVWVLGTTCQAMETSHGNILKDVGPEGGGMLCCMSLPVQCSIVGV